MPHQEIAANRAVAVAVEVWSTTSRRAPREGRCRINRPGNHVRRSNERTGRPDGLPDGSRACEICSHVAIAAELALFVLGSVFDWEGALPVNENDYATPPTPGPREPIPFGVWFMLGIFVVGLIALFVLGNAKW